jgi:hypothetical protein
MLNFAFAQICEIIAANETRPDDDFSIVLLHRADLGVRLNPISRSPVHAQWVDPFRLI